MESIGWQVVLMRVSGVDAERYLHNRLTNNVKALKAGQSQWAAALTPQGKTQALFLLRRVSADAFFLLAEGGNLAEIKEGLLRFKVADRLVVEDQSDSYALWIEGGTTEQEGITYFNQKFGAHTGQLAVASREKISQITSAAIVSDEATYRFLSAEQRFPRFPSELNEKYLFSESGLEVAVSTNKGCYVGQEVVHKISAFAMLPYELGVAQFEPGATVAIGESVLSETSEPCGVIVSVYAANHKVLAFIRVKSETSKNLKTVLSDGMQGTFMGICEHA